MSLLRDHHAEERGDFPGTVLLRHFSVLFPSVGVIHLRSSVSHDVLGLAETGVKELQLPKLETALEHFVSARGLCGLLLLPVCGLAQEALRSVSERVLVKLEDELEEWLGSLLPPGSLLFPSDEANDRLLTLRNRTGSVGPRSELNKTKRGLGNDSLLLLLPDQHLPRHLKQVESKAVHIDSPPPLQRHFLGEQPTADDLLHDICPVFHLFVSVPAKQDFVPGGKLRGSRDQERLPPIPAGQAQQNLPPKVVVFLHFLGSLCDSSLVPETGAHFLGLHRLLSHLETPSRTLQEQAPGQEN